MYAFMPSSHHRVSPAKLLTVELNTRALSPNTSSRSVSDCGHQALGTTSHDQDTLVNQSVIDSSSDQHRDIRFLVRNGDAVVEGRVHHVRHGGCR